jgi:hypothetical protein
MKAKYGRAQALSGRANRAAQTVEAGRARGFQVCCTQNGHSRVFQSRLAGCRRIRQAGCREVPRVACGDRHHRMARLRVPFRRTLNKPQALDDASVPSRRGRLGTSNFGGPQSGIASSDVRKPLPLENSSSSSPIRANTRLIGCNPNDAALRTSIGRKLFLLNTLSSGARLPSAPERRGETERKATLAGSHSP